MPFSISSNTLQKLSSGFKSANLLDLHFDLVIEAKGEISFINNRPLLLIPQTAGECLLRQNDVEKRHVWHDSRSVQFHPAHTHLSIKALSRFTMTAIFIPQNWFQTALSSELQFGGVDLNDFTSTDPFLVGATQLLAAIPFVPDVPSDPMLVEVLAVRIASRVLQLLAKKQAPGQHQAKGPGLPQKKLEQIVEYVEANLHRTIRMPELAEIAGMSESHFSRSFRAATGVTAMRFIMNKRVQMAKDLLINSKKSLAEIAFECGFASQPHLTTSFKELMGATPAAFRAGRWPAAAVLTFLHLPFAQQVLDLLAA